MLGSIAMRCVLNCERIGRKEKREREREREREIEKKREEESTFWRSENAPSMIFGKEIFEIVGLCGIRL